MRKRSKSGPDKKEPKGVPFDPEFSRLHFLAFLLVKTLKNEVPKNGGLKSAIMQWSSCPQMSIKGDQKRVHFSDFYQKNFNFSKMKLFQRFLEGVLEKRVKKTLKSFSQNYI